LRENLKTQNHNLNVIERKLGEIESEVTRIETSAKPTPRAEMRLVSTDIRLGVGVQEKEQSIRTVSVSTNPKTQKKRLIISTEELANPEFLRAFLEIVKKTQTDLSLEYIIVASGDKSELWTEHRLLQLMRVENPESLAENPFLTNVRLYGHDSLGDGKSDVARLNLITQQMRREAGIASREFSSNVAAIVKETLAGKTNLKRVTPMIAFKKGEAVALLQAVLSLLDSSIDLARWQQIAPDGYIGSDNFDNFINVLGELRLAQLGFAHAA